MLPLSLIKMKRKKSRSYKDGRTEEKLGKSKGRESVCVYVCAINNIIKWREREGESAWEGRDDLAANQHLTQEVFPPRETVLPSTKPLDLGKRKKTLLAAPLVPKGLAGQQKEKTKEREKKKKKKAVQFFFLTFSHTAKKKSDESNYILLTPTLTVLAGQINHLPSSPDSALFTLACGREWNHVTKDKRPTGPTCT